MTLKNIPSRRFGSPEGGFLGRFPNIGGDKERDENLQN